METMRNNKGLSLVELVIAIAMSTIVMGAAAMFLYNADKSYHAAEFSIDVQMEAQIVMEQLGNWVMESNRIYVGPEDKNVLILYSIPRNNGKDLADLYPASFTDFSETDNLATRRIIFAAGKKLYMVVTNDIADALADYENMRDNIDALDTTAWVDDKNCICEYLDGDETGFAHPFTVSKSPVSVPDEQIASVMISLTLKEGMQSYPESYTVRNTFSARNGLFGAVTTPEPTATPEAEPESEPEEEP